MAMTCHPAYGSFCQDASRSQTVPTWARMLLPVVSWHPIILLDHLTPTLIYQRKADLRHPTFELIYYEAQFAILLQWLCQRPIEPWMLRSVSSNPNRHLGLVSRCWGLRWISPPFTFPCQSTGCCHVMGWELGPEMNGINEKQMILFVAIVLHYILRIHADPFLSSFVRCL